MGVLRRTNSSEMRYPSSLYELQNWLCTVSAIPNVLHPILVCVYYWKAIATTKETWMRHLAV